MFGRKTITLAHAADDAVDQHVADGAGGQQGVDALANPPDERLNPPLGVGAEAERAPEHQPHEEEEDGEAPQLVGHQRVDERRCGAFGPLAGGERLLERSGDEAVLLVGNRRLDILAQRLGDALRLAVANLHPLGEAFAAAQPLLDLVVALEHLHRVVARREGLGQLAAVFVHVAVEPADALLDHGTQTDVDVAHPLVAVLVDRNHGVEQRFDALVVARLDGNHRHAEHAAQTVVVERGAAGVQLVVHVERHYDARVYINQFGSQIEVAFEVRGHHRVDNHVGVVLLDVAAHVALLGRISREGVGARQVGHPERIAAVGAAPPLGIDRHAAVVAHMLVTARDGVEQRGLAAVGVAHQGDFDVAAALVNHPLDTARFGKRIPLRGTSRRIVNHLTGLFVGQLLCFAVGEHLHHVGLAAPQRDVVTHDLVFDGVLQRCIEQHLDALPPHEAHLHDSATEAAVTVHLENRCRFAGLQIR